MTGKIRNESTFMMVNKNLYLASECSQLPNNLLLNKRNNRGLRKYQCWKPSVPPFLFFGFLPV